MDANKDTVIQKADIVATKIESTPAAVFIDKVTANLPVNADARGQLEAIGKLEEGSSEVVKRNLKEVEKLGVGFVELYKKVIEDNPDLAETTVYIGDRSNELALGSSGIREINGSLESYIVMVDPKSKIYSSLLDKSRSRIVDVVASRIGIAKDRIDDEMIRKFVFLHELGHAKEHMALDINQQGELSNAEVVEKTHARRRLEMKTLPVPRKRPSEVVKMLESGELNTYFEVNREQFILNRIYSPEELVLAQEKAYPELPSEKVAIDFAKRMIDWLVINPVDEERRKSELAEFVLENITSFDQLAIVVNENDNHYDIEKKSDKKFALSLKELVEKASYSRSDSDTEGVYFNFRKMEKAPIVVKSMRGYSGPMTDDEAMVQEKKFKNFQREHEITYEYFGSRFVPDTIYLILNSPLHDFNITKYVTVQEFKKGRQLKNLKYKKPDDLVITPKLRSEAEAFLVAYDRMASITGSIIDFDILIDADNERLWLFDSTTLVSPRTDVAVWRKAKFKNVFGIPLTAQEFFVLQDDSIQYV